MRQRLSFHVTIPVQAIVAIFSARAFNNVLSEPYWRHNMKQSTWLSIQCCQKKHKKVLQRTLLPKSNQKNNQKVCFGKFLDVPKWLPDRAVAEFRIATVHDCLSKPVNALGIAQSPLCKLCDFNEKMDAPFFLHATVHSALDPCGADIGSTNITRRQSFWRDRLSTCIRSERKVPRTNLPSFIDDPGRAKEPHPSRAAVVEPSIHRTINQAVKY
ncbi:hypothetical protein TNCV_2326701 [Trichonephila clavipes]|nr:hypothetical protein TNCV_2326701 [Trichonephila clavipes]